MMAVLQIEIARSALRNNDPYSGMDSRPKRLRFLFWDAVEDTLRNGGTFTLVVRDDRIIAAQHAEAIGFDEEALEEPSDAT